MYLVGDNSFKTDFLHLNVEHVLGQCRLSLPLPQMVSLVFHFLPGCFSSLRALQKMEEVHFSMSVGLHIGGPLFGGHSAGKREKKKKAL